MNVTAHKRLAAILFSYFPRRFFCQRRGFGSFSLRPACLSVPILFFFFSAEEKKADGVPLPFWRLFWSPYVPLSCIVRAS